MDDTTVKVLAKTKTRTGRLWVYLRDDRPFGGQGPPVAMFDYSPTRHGEYPRKVLAAWSGVMQADAFSGYNALYAADRKPEPVVEAACWAHGRRDFFDLAKLAKAPIAAEIVRRIDELFAIERAINGKPPEVRRAIRQERSKPLVAALKAYMAEQLERLSPKNDVAKAIRYMLTRWPSFTRFLDDGRVCLSTDDAEKRESSARRSGLGRSLGRLFLPRHHHPLVGLLGTPNVVGFSLSDLLDPIVATWSRLAIFAWSAGLERSFA